MPSFQRQAKRQKRNCADCYEYRPHEHPERLAKVQSVKPEYVWIGYDSHPETVHYPEPSRAKTERLISDIEKSGIKVKRKLMREGI